MTADRDARDRAVHERDRNVLVEASAGTGKTGLVVERFLELVAPSGVQMPIPIERLAAITFTRKAAGELRVRTRNRILGLLECGSGRRSAALYDALSKIDVANITTIHGFADSLLRMWPDRADIDPRYELEDDAADLARETFERLLHGVETGTLADLVDGTAAVAFADEAAGIVRDLRRAEARLRSFEGEHWTYHGLDGVVAGLIEHRDVDVDLAHADGSFDRDAFDDRADEYRQLVHDVSSCSTGGRWLTRNAAMLAALEGERDPAILYRELVSRLDAGPRGRRSQHPTRKRDFDDDDDAWDAWKAFDGDTRREAMRATPLRDDLLAPLYRWLGVRLARLRPVVLALNRRVKARRRVVDHVDLLLRLRDLLRDDLPIRRACQGLFDHVFVDELQDTDPLQAEIVVFLCERGRSAAAWQDVTVGGGTLTIVGDPKQSIYRFRRADVETYQLVVDVVRRSPHLEIELTASFRSAPPLVGWLNDRMAHILGDRAGDGEVAHRPLTIGRASGPIAGVHVVRYEAPAGDIARYRALEATTLARYLRHLVGGSGVSIVDPITGEARRPRFGDIAVLTVATTRLPILFEAFDSDDVPHAARGGTLFLDDPVHRQFLLGLCAIADRDDGIAAAALYRPPFFAIGLDELARHRSEPSEHVDTARSIVRELRRRRFERDPGATARALLEETGFGRTIALGPNGPQRLARLRELCFRIEVLATNDGRDFDGTMRHVRGWLAAPVALDPPHPVGGEAVQVLTIHQAKGLEFPIVVLWDGRASWNERVQNDAWAVERDGRGWALRLDPLRWEEPPGLDLARRECRRREAERKRLVYVATTRARDLLVIPRPSDANDSSICGRLVGALPHPAVVETPIHSPTNHASWFDASAPASRSRPSGVIDDDRVRWMDRAAVACRPLARPRRFVPENRAFGDGRERFGAAFGTMVHVAIGHALRGVAVVDAVRCGAIAGCTSNRLREAMDDVERALACLRSLDVSIENAALEYPIADATENGELVAGFIDLVAVTKDAVVVLDFKTENPPVGDTLPDDHVEQVTGYARALRRLAHPRPIRAGLLFTAVGVVRWVTTTPRRGEAET